MHEADEIIYRRFLASRAEEEFRILLDRHRESLTLFLYGIIHNMEDAEELMLDAYAEVAANARFSERSTFKTWLFAIGKNKALLYLRKQRRFQTNEVPDTPSEETPELNILKEERNRQLYKALWNLHEDYRQILTLLFFEQMSCEDAGKVMGKNRKQIYNLAERGKRALKYELRRMGFLDA
jgi:RNA polymerase sigma-70 factor (ECF subfamily)